MARDRNTKDESSGFVGYVLRFMVRSDFLKRTRFTSSAARSIEKTGYLGEIWKH
jgi:hypothetical protein